MNVVPIRDRHPESGTLLWIGETSLPEFQAAYQHCVQQADQIALRQDALAAIERPASDVRRIVVARSNRHPVDQATFHFLSQQHREAAWIDLLGPLCEGIRQSSSSGSMRVAWHRWDQVLLDWFQESGRPRTRESQLAFNSVAVNSVAVLASNAATAQAYLDLADSCGVTAVWCHSPHAMRMRNLDAVWWDDSVADSTEPEIWRERLSAFETPRRAVRHAWITHSAWLEQRQAAIDGGIDTILTKPFRIDALVKTLGTNRVLTRRADAA